MNERAHKLGIPTRDLHRALALVRQLRGSALADRLDPRATRIALIFALLCDTHFSLQKLTPEQSSELTEIAVELFEPVLRRDLT